MTSETPARRPSAIGLVVLVLFAGLIGWVATRGGPSRTSPETGEIPAVLDIEDNGMRYTIHLPTGQEGLFDLGEDPRCLKNLAQKDPVTTRRLRMRLEERLRLDTGVKDIEELRATYRERIEQLRALGYL